MENEVYTSIVVWTLEPGSMERSVKIVHDTLIPEIDRVAGLLQHLIITSGQNEVTTVFVYDNRRDAEAGYAVLRPLSQESLKGIVRGVQRHNGEVRRSASQRRSTVGRLNGPPNPICFNCLD
jgi:hypothetical protein